MKKLNSLSILIESCIYYINALLTGKQGDYMKLIDIQKPYNMIISLGSECGPALHLRRHHLRKTS